VARMSGPKRKKIVDMLIQRDGQICFIGTERLESEKAVVDHWNNRNDDNRPVNLHLLCRSMNSSKNPRGLGKETKILSSVSVRREIVDGIIRPQMVSVQSAEFLKNLEGEPHFRHWVFYNVVRCVELKVNEIVDSGAELIHASPTTIKRYLTKITSSLGLYMYAEDVTTGEKVIRLKPRWDTFREKINEKRILEEQARNWKQARKEEEKHLAVKEVGRPVVVLSGYGTN
jgi:hypothetical protein